MTTPITFKYDDFGKKTSDLISFKFPVSSIKVSNVTQKSGFAVSTEFNSKKGGEITGKIRPQYEIKDTNLVVKASLDTENTGSMGLSVTDLGAPQSDLDLNLVQSICDKKISTSILGEWNFQKGPISVNLGGISNLEGEIKPVINGAVVFQKPDYLFWTVGGEYGVGTPLGMTSCNAKAAYVQPSSEALFSVKYKKESEKITYKTSWFQITSPNVKYGVDFTTKIGAKNGFQTSAVVVGEYKVDDHTTLRAKSTTQAAENKVYPNLRLGLGLTQQITPGCVATLGADFNARHLFGTGPEGLPNSVGIEINLC